MPYDVDPDVLGTIECVLQTTCGRQSSRWSSRRRRRTRSWSESFASGCEMLQGLI
jgi:hypothetical protein